MKLISLTVFFLTTCCVYAGVFDLSVYSNGRINGMANSGMSYTSGAGAIPINPAGLSGVTKLEAEITMNGCVTSGRAPANGPDTASTSTTFIPLMYAGAVYRFSELVTAGFNFYIPSGGGGTYKNIDYGDATLTARDLTGTTVFMEFGPSISFDVLPNLKIGASYRLNYAKQEGSMYDLSNAGSGVITYNTSSLSGFGYTGFRLGVQYEPVDNLHVGLSYTSPVKVNMSGTMSSLLEGTTTTTDFTLSSVAEYADKIIFGLAYEFVPDKLIVAFDYEFFLSSMYSASVVTINELYTDVNVPLGNKNSHGVRMGLDYQVTEKIPFRFGFALYNDVINSDYHNATNGGAPGLLYVVSMGSGYKINDNWTLDGAYTLYYNAGTVASPAGSEYAVPGYYRGIMNFFTASLIYKFGLSQNSSRYEK